VRNVAVHLERLLLRQMLRQERKRRWFLLDEERARVANPFEDNDRVGGQCSRERLDTRMEWIGVPRGHSDRYVLQRARMGDASFRAKSAADAYAALFTPWDCS
jgi:hypothetical protein